MKKQISAVVGAAALVVAGFAGGSALNGSAEAQGAQKPPVILTINSAQVVAQSKAGKTIPDQAESVRDSVTKELEAEAEKLRKDIENYQKNSSLMSDEVRQQTEQELAMRQQVGLPQRIQVMDRALAVTLQNAQNKVLIESRPIMREILDKRGATILLDQSSLMYFAPETDITQEVIAELDKKVSKIEVEKISLAEIEKQLRERAQAQAENN